MGATDFRNVIKAKTPAIGFAKLNGGTDMGSYHGNIRCKPSFVVVSKPKGMRATTVAKAIKAVSSITRDWDTDELLIAKPQRDFPALNILAMYEIYSDKFGPALCMELGKNEFIFAGLASE